MCIVRAFTAVSIPDGSSPKVVLTSKSDTMDNNALGELKAYQSTILGNFRVVDNVQCAQDLEIQCEEYIFGSYKLINRTTQSSCV